MLSRLCLLFFFIGATVFGQEKKEINLNTPTGNIKGELLLPKGSNSIPLVLIISGSGPTDRDGNNAAMKNNSLKMLAEGLSDYNIASVRFDKRGVGESKSAGIKESDLRFEHYVNDVNAWIDTLKKDTRFSQIIILGHSEGSTIGMIASQNINVDRFISIAGPGEQASVIIKEQLKSQPDFIKNVAFPMIEKLEKGDTITVVPPLLFSLFRPSIQPYLISWFKYNPQIEIAKLNKSILIIQGDTDIQVKAIDAKKLKQSNPKAKLEIIEGMNHVLKASVLDRKENIQTYNNPDLPLKEGLVKSIVDFIITK